MNRIYPITTGDVIFRFGTGSISSSSADFRRIDNAKKVDFHFGLC